LEQILGRRLDWSRLMPKREARNWELTLQASTLPGIESLLRSARERCLPVGVASNSENGWVEDGLRRLGLRDYVDAVVTRDMVLNPKPAPDIYLKTVQTLQVEPGHAVALEDSEPGCRSAKQAGLKTVAIPNRFSERQDLTVADLIVKSATELSFDRLAALVAKNRD
jgi:HAD superfamily hydrolase (TIGR01509 family)